MRILLLLALFYVACIAGIDQGTIAQTNPDSYKWNDAERRSAEEIDVVAYFSLGESDNAVYGKEEFSYNWEGFTWQFSSQKNLDLFKENPEKYIPQYGGYCAYAVSKNYTASIDPNAWTVHDGKLYLNYSKGVRSTWSKDMNERIVNGNNNWPNLKKKL